jgi:hypothetical protein
MLTINGDWGLLGDKETRRQGDKGTRRIILLSPHPPLSPSPHPPLVRLSVVEYPRSEMMISDKSDKLDSVNLQ